MSLQHKIYRWMDYTFRGMLDWASVNERVRRLTEEVTEVAQASGMSREEMHRMVDFVYDRPSGDLEQEVAQAGLCLYGLAESLHVDLEEEVSSELARVDTPEMIRRVRDKWQLKCDAGVTGPRLENVDSEPRPEPREWR